MVFQQFWSPASSRQPPAASRQPSAASHQPSAASRQPQAVSRQQPAVNRQPHTQPLFAGGDGAHAAWRLQFADPIGVSDPQHVNFQNIDDSIIEDSRMESLRARGGALGPPPSAIQSWPESMWIGGLKIAAFPI